MTRRRLNTGGLIDRGAPRRFLFDGRWYSGFAGDTITSALLANGVRVVGRSFKYHRPRGVWGAWVDDPNAIMDVTLRHRRFPNCPAATTYLEDRMELRAVNAWPSARFDMKGGLDLFHRWLGAGFYYKTFIWPHWHVFEPMIRRLSGHGSVSPQVFDDDLSDQRHASCDLLVVGGGPAGLAAARAAAEAGQDVLLVDDHDHAGGSAYRMGTVEGCAATAWVTEQTAALKAAGARVLMRTTAFGVYDHGLVALAEDRGFGRAPRLWRVRPARTVLATGALDRPLTFAGNDRPGVMSLEAAVEYLARYGVLVGVRLCVLSNNSHADAAIATLESAGAEVIRVDPATGPVESIGRLRLSGLRQGGNRHVADAVLTSGGLTPLVHLWRHAGGKLDWREDLQAFVPGAGPEAMEVVGAANGTFDADAALAEARAAVTGGTRPEATSSYRLRPLWPDPKGKGRQWIDFQHDVTLADVGQAAVENYTSVEHLKRYTTLGMALDQGKTSNMAGLAAMAAIRGRPIPAVGTTTFRPPFVPVPMTLYSGRNAGESFRPLRRLPLERAHRAANAALSEYGGWLRPAWYGSEDSQRHIRDEIIMARQHAGLFDASPLGKIEVLGPDAAAFLDFVYYNTVCTLAPGQIRYGMMLTETGTVFDDGVLARVAPEHFIVFCSSGHATAVYRLLQSWRQDGHDPDRIFVHDATDQWAMLTVTGPKARHVLEALDLDCDLSPATFPHMHLRAARFRGDPLRIARVSFSGDLSFELSIGAARASPLWQALSAAIREQDGGPIGLEALSVLRAEKGYIIVGRDTDGSTMPHDLGFDGPRHRKRAAFVGDRSLHSDAANDPERRQLVGLRVPEGSLPLPTGAHLIVNEADRCSIGIVTSSYDNPTLNHPIALALLNGGAGRHGERLKVYHLGELREATVCSPCFLDPAGERLDA